MAKKTKKDTNLIIAIIKKAASDAAKKSGKK